MRSRHLSLVQFSTTPNSDVSSTACSFAQIRRTDGLWYWAEYSTFSISDEIGKYQLTVAGYCGDAGDAIAMVRNIWKSRGRQFSTLDSDNDICTCNCAVEYSSGWWYARCATSDINRPLGTWTTESALADVQDSRMLVKFN